MINIDNIGNLKKCRVWLEELPSTECKVIEVISSVLKNSNYKRGINQRIAVELFVAPRYYAFLGVEYDYKEGNNLEVCVNITEISDKIINDSLALPSDKVHSGISNEYAQTILNTSIKVFNNLSNVPMGVLIFNVGGYSDYGSNQIIFSKITSIIIRLLVGKQGNIELEELKNIIRNELDKPLTDI
jgi:hypothetical protein